MSEVDRFFAGSSDDALSRRDRRLGRIQRSAAEAAGALDRARQAQQHRTDHEAQTQIAARAANGISLMRTLVDHARVEADDDPLVAEIAVEFINAAKHEVKARVRGGR